MTLIRLSNWKIFRRRIFNVIQRWYNVGLRHWNNVKITLRNLDTTVFHRCTTSFQSFFNDYVTLSQRCFNVASTLAQKTISKPFLRVISMNFQIHKFYSIKWESILCYILTSQLLINYLRDFLTIVKIVAHNGNNQRYIQNPVKHLWWIFLRK